MSLKSKRPGLMALEGLEDATGADASQTAGEETQGTSLGTDATAGTTINEEAKPTPDGTGSGEAGGETGVVETENKGVTNTPELEGKVVARDANSAVAQGDAIAILDVTDSGAELTVAEEGFKGAALGFAAGFLGLIPGGNLVAGAAGSSHANKLKAEIEAIAKELEKAATDQGAALVKQGKLAANDVTKNVKVGTKGIISGALLGGLFGPIYGAIKGSEIEELRNELKDKAKQLDLVLKKEGDRQKVATEGYEADHAMVAMEDAVEGVIELQDDIQEAVAVVETVEGINEQLELAASDDHTGIAPKEAEAICIAVEHMKQTVGYSGKAVFPALEAFGGTHSKREGARMALESNQRFLADLKKGLKFAQEGLEEKVESAWGAYWTSEEKLAERAAELKGIVGKATYTDKAMSNPVWGKAINPEDKPFVKGDEVAEGVTKLAELAGASKLAEILSGAATKVAEAPGEGEEASGLASASEEAGKLVTQAESDFPGEGKSETDFAPLDQDSATKLLEVVEGLLNGADVKAAQEKLQAALDACEGDCKDANDVSSHVLQLQRIKLRVCSSALSYIAASASEEAKAAPAEAEAAAETPAAKEATAEGEAEAAKEEKAAEAERGTKAE